MRNRLLTLHHELLYPAFLGAALFEFTRRLVPGLVHDGFLWFETNALWIATSLLFMLYFSVAFLALAEAVDAKSDKFGCVSFAANLAEISLILGISVLLIDNNAPQEGESLAPKTLNYLFVYISWILIPLTGGISNGFSDRPVRWAVSIIPGVIGLVGIVWGYQSGWDLGGRYWILLSVMYASFVVYCHSVDKYR
jgi:hypothetical protein